MPLGCLNSRQRWHYAGRVMNRLVIPFCLLILALSSAVAPAQAQLLWPPMVCKSYLAADGNAPTEIIAYFHAFAVRRGADRDATMPQMILRKCDNGTVRRYTLQLPARSDFGVCHFDARDMTDLFSADGAYLGERATPRHANRLWEEMMVVAGQCPAQDDRRYVPSTLPPGLFRQLVAEWERIVAAKKVPAEVIAVTDKNELTTQALSSLAASLRSAEPPVIESLSIEPIEVAHGRSTVQLDVRRNGTEPSGWMLGFDFFQAGWRLVNVSTWVA